MAEGVGFEPTVTCATMVFETIRFGRSRIPPGGMLRHDRRGSDPRSAAAGGEELLDQRRARFGVNAGHDGDLVVEPRVGGEVVERTGGTRARVGRTEHDQVDARRQRGSRAHRARLDRRDQRVTAEPPAADDLRGTSQRQDLRVRGRVAAQLLSLCADAITTPSAMRATTAPTGTSSCASAAPASSSAIVMRSESSASVGRLDIECDPIGCAVSHVRCGPHGLGVRRRDRSPRGCVGSPVVRDAGTRRRRHRRSAGDVHPDRHAVRVRAGPWPTETGLQPWYPRESWEGHGVLVLMRPGDAYAVWHFWLGDDAPVRVVVHQSPGALPSHRDRLRHAGPRARRGRAPRRSVVLEGRRADGATDTGRPVLGRRSRGDPGSGARPSGAMLDAGTTWWDPAFTSWAPDPSWTEPVLPSGWEQASGQG